MKYTIWDFTWVIIIPIVLFFLLIISRFTFFAKLKRTTFKFVTMPLFALLIGACLGGIIMNAAVSGCFSEWETLPTPPEKAEKIIALAEGDEVWVETTDKNIYHYSWDASINSANWTLTIQPIPTSEPESSEIQYCEPKCTLMRGIIDTQAICLPPPGEAGRIYSYALRNDGRIFTSFDYRGSGLGALAIVTIGPLLGASACGIPVILIMAFSGFLDWLQARAQKREEEEIPNNEMDC
jgi:hypothetical protein